MIALIVDQFLFWIQRQLFPHVYSGDGVLNYALRKVLHLWDDLKSMVFGKSIESVASIESVGGAGPTGAGGATASATSVESAKSAKKVEETKKP